MFQEDHQTGGNGLSKWTDLPTCPHCGYEDQAYHEYQDGYEYLCGDCGKEFEITIVANPRFFSKAINKKEK